MITQEIKKIILTGGGTAGSVSPLLAIVEDLSSQPPLPASGAGQALISPPALLAQAQRAGRGGEGVRYEFLWIGSKTGPEGRLVKKEKIEFKTIVAGKYRRYFSLKNLFSPFFILTGLIQSIIIIWRWQPNLIISAGSFISVPVVWAGRLFNVPVLVHQQDIRPGLANKLMAPFTKIITVTFEKSLKDYGAKASWTGNPIRQVFQVNQEKVNARNYFNLTSLPTILIIGGGTGAQALNQLVWQSLPELAKFCQIIHLTGKNKLPDFKNQFIGYKVYEFLEPDKLALAYFASDLVISRCGLGVLTELSSLAKPAILIPLPHSHQEENADIFRQKEAAIVLKQNQLTVQIFIDNIEKLINDQTLRKKLSQNIGQFFKPEANKKICEIIKSLIS